MTASVQPMDASLLRIGQEFAGYRVEAGMGRQSGVGRVYEATHLESERRVALKVFSAQALQDLGLRRHFTETARAHAKVRHTAVAALEDWGTEPAPYIVMTLVRGPTLADLLAQGDLGDQRVLKILGAVASGLEAARRRGLVYRRLQPGGVLVDVEDSDHAYLTDFGAGRPARSTESIETGRLGAFADYISPEEADDGETSTASTVYSFGAMVFEGLTGRPPYAAEQQWATLRAHLEATPPVPSELRPDLPVALDPVIERALAKRPQARQASPGRLMGEVDGAYPAEARVAPVAGSPRRRRPSLGRVAVVLLIAALVAASAALGMVASGSSADKPGKRAALRVHNNDLSLRYPADWSKTRRVPEIAGLTLANPVALTPPSDALDGGELVAGRVSRGRVLDGRGQIVDLHGVLGRRYTGLAERGSSRRAVVYAVPSANGQVVAACLGPTEGTFANRCRRIASTLRARHEGVALAPASPDYATALDGVVTRLGRVRVKGRRRLARAVTPAGQRRLAGRLSRDYRRLASVLSRIEAPQQARPSQARAVRQLRRASRGFRDMSRAARSRSPGRWRSARRGVRSAEGNFQGTLRSLRRLGYDVG